MLIETKSPAVCVSDIRHPLPPAVRFDASAAAFTGTAEAGQTIRITDRTDWRTLTATAGPDGGWTIRLAAVPRLYTTFEIIACDPQTGADSAVVRFTFGGSNPRLADVEASAMLAFGLASPGEKITVLGPLGQTIGQSFVFGRSGVWTVRFRQAVGIGDRLCILAETPDGNTSMPVFTRAAGFCVDDRNVARIAGSGAEPGDVIQLFDTKSGQGIASAMTGDTGTWAIAVDPPLAAGTRIAVQRNHIDGATTEGPVFTALKNDCLAPVISSFSGGQMGGVAEPGLRVIYAQYRNSQMIHNGWVNVEESGLWTSGDAPDCQPFDFRTGDVLVARTENAEGTAESLIPSCVIIGGNRPGAPLVAHTDENGAWGYAERLKNIIISSEDAGLIWATRSGWNGYWSADWTQAVGSLPTTTRVVFEVLDSWLLTNDVQTSTATIRYADAAAGRPAAPVIDTYIPSDIAGTEATLGTIVVVHNSDEQDQAINPGGNPVGDDGRWEVKPTGSAVPHGGDDVYAVAWALVDGKPSINSPPSASVQISDFVPPPPDVTSAFTDDIEGTEAITDPANQVITRIYISPKNDLSRTPAGVSPYLSSESWKITPYNVLTIGEVMVAWAQTDPGAKSTETEFTIEANIRPLPPVIGDYTTANVYGSGTVGTSVALYLNDAELPVGTSTVKLDTSWQVDTGTPVVKGDKLKAIATDSNGRQSDPFYILAYQAPTELTVNAVTTTLAAVNVTSADQTLLAWRQSDGMKVIEAPLGGAGNSTVRYLAGITIEDTDIISFSAQDTSVSPTEGTMTHFNGKPVGYIAV